MGVLASEHSANRRRTSFERPGSIEDCTVVLERRQLAGNPNRRRILGASVDPGARPDRRWHRIWLSLVDQVVQVRREELSGVLHEWQRREQGSGVSRARYGRGRHQHKFQHPRHARADGKGADRLHFGGAWTLESAAARLWATVSRRGRAKTLRSRV